MTDALDINAATWRSILEDVDEPTVDAVAELLAGQFGRGFDVARDELEDALADPSSPVTVTDDAIVVDDTPADTDTSDDTDDVNGSDAGDDAGETVAYDTPVGRNAAFIDIFRRAQAIDGREPWAYVTETALRQALDEAGHEYLLDAGHLQQNTDWKVADLDETDDTDAHKWRYYYTPAAPDTRPDEFRRFHELLTADAPDGYEPYYFRVERAGKAPATQYGSWKDETNRLDFDDALAHMKDGGNVGIAGTPDDALVNIDIDDGEATTPADLPESIRVRSRSRGESFHTWGFNPDGDVPNLPTDDLGEIRTDWQYVVAPGSFAASDPSEIPDDADHAGYYTVEHEATVPSITYDDLPDAFHDWKAEQEAAHDAPPDDVAVDDILPDGVEHDPGVDRDAREDVDGSDAGDNDDETPTGASDVFDVSAIDIVDTEGGSKNPADRWTALFHGSSTSANMSVSKQSPDDGGAIQCWRHNVAHGGLQALAVLSEHSPSKSCQAIGTGHRKSKKAQSNAGPCRYKGDWRLVWWAWEYAKGAGYVPEDDPIPYRALLNLAVRDDVINRDELVERETDDGDSYVGFPDAGAYNAALDHVRETYDREPGRDDADPGRPENQLVALPDIDDPDERTDDVDAGELEDRAGDELEEPPHGALTVGHARERTKAALVDAFTGGRDVLIEALPSMGKSYGSVAAAVETGKPATILVGRGNNEQYARIREWCRNQGLDVGDKREPNGDVYILPSFKRDCETANGDHGADWEDTVDEWYQAGATPKQIHKLGPYTLDVDALPCQHDGATCGYTRRWDFDPDDFDVLIGHYTHAHKPKVTGDRVVVVDEFTGAYETELAGDDLRGAINQYLDEHGVAARDEFIDDRDGGYLAYQSYADLLLARDDVERRTAAIEWLRRRGVDPDETGAIRFGDDDGKDAAAPLAIYTILKSAAGGSLGNGYERADFRPDVDADRRLGVFNPHGKDRKDDEPAVSILRPPGALAYADAVVGLDGTPTLEMWELMCGRTFDHRVVLEGRRAEYLETALNFRILPTTDAIKPYNNTEYVNDDHDAALLEAITAHHDERPAVISTSTALRSWGKADVFDDVDLATDDPYGRVDGGPAVGATYHGDVLGSNAFGDERVGAVIGSNHYGDGFVKRWGAYADESVTRQHADGDADPDTKPRGSDLSYGPFGDRILRHMTEHDTLQAVMRFGRDAGGATVYVDTDTLPEWVPTHGRGDVRAVSDGLVGVLDALEDVGPASTAELVEHDDVPIGDSQVRDHLDTLREIGVVETSRDPDDGRRHIHHAADTTPVTPTGVVELPDDVEPPARTRPWSRPDAVGGDGGDADADTARSITGDGYDRSIYVRPVIDPSDEDTPVDVPDGRIREVAIPDGGIVAFTAGVKADGGVVDAGDELEDDDLADTDRVALGGLTAAGLDVHAKTSDDDGDPWYVTRDGGTGDVSAHRRGSTPSTRRRSRPATLGRRGGRRGDVARYGPTLIDERTDDVDEREDT